MQENRSLAEILRFWATQQYIRLLRYARAKGFPLRRIKYVMRNYPRVGLYTTVVMIGVVAIGIILLWIGRESTVFFSPENQAQWFAEILIIIFAGVVLHFALREKGPPAPSLVLDDLKWYKAKDGRRVFGVKIRNNGDHAAIDCIATLEMDGIEKFEIQSQKKTPEFESSDIELTVDLCWDQTSKKSKTLRSDDKGELLVARWVPGKGSKVEHFAIVGPHGWRSTTVRLDVEPSHYFGKVKIAPLNGKACYVSICLWKDKLRGAIMELAL